MGEGGREGRQEGDRDEAGEVEIIKRQSATSGA